MTDYYAGWAVGNASHVFNDVSKEVVRISLTTTEIFTSPEEARRMAQFLLLAADNAEKCMKGVQG